MTYELFKEDPVAFFAVVLVNLIFTLIIYGLFPLVFAKFRKKIITEKKYKRVCYLVNGFCCIGGFVYTYGMETLNFAPYILWTSIFVRLGLKILFSKNMIDGYIPKEKYREKNAFVVNLNPHSCDKDIRKESDKFIIKKLNKSDVIKAKSNVSEDPKQVESFLKSKLENNEDTLALKSQKLRNRTIFLAVILLIFIAACANYMVEAYQLNKQLTKEKESYGTLQTEYTNLRTKYDTLNYNYLDLQNKHNKYTSLYKDLISNYNDINPEYTFYHDNAVIAVTNGHNYHKYGCSWIRWRDVYIYNKEYAVALGLEPCYDCYYEDIKW